MKVKCIFIIFLAIFIFGCDRWNSQHSFQGYVEGENVYLAVPDSGVLKHLLVQRGDSVKQGQLLFQLDEDPQNLIVKQRESGLLQAQKILRDLQKPRRTQEIEAIQAQIDQTDAQLKLAEIRMKRIQILLVKGDISKDAYDEAVAVYNEQRKLKAQYESNLHLAQLGSRDELINAQQAQVTSLIAKLNEAKWHLEQKTMVAPYGGYIFDTYYREGEFVASQQPVLSLLPPQNVRIEFFIPVEQLGSVKRDQIISFSCYSCKNRSEAIISYISPEAEYIPPLVYSRENSEKLVFRIKARLKQPDQFKPGQPVTVYLP